MVFKHEDSSGGADDHHRQLAHRHEVTASGKFAISTTPRPER
jgi:hypothetical protein